MPTWEVESGLWGYSPRCLGREGGGAPAAGGGGQGLWVGKEKFDWVVSRGAEAFESGHTCLSCERLCSLWLASIPERRQKERGRKTETERAE